jgi:6-pyruvoyltetrahydropterin/6-carboxytetrahydropterin synthase
LYEVSTSASFSAAHRIREYSGKCERMHGHNWKVEVTVRSTELNDLGIVIDFRDLRKIVSGILEEVDHRIINDVAPFTSINPTAENLAKWLHDEISKKIAHVSVESLYVKVRETDSSFAAYSS